VLVLYVVAGLAALLILVLCIPLDTRVMVDTSAERKFSLQVSWLFGLIHRDLSKSGRKSRREKRGKERKPVITGILEGDFTPIVSQASDLYNQFRDFAFDVYRQLKIVRVTGDFIVGLEDPVLTGLLFAVVGPVNALLNQHPRYNVNIHPYFADEVVLEGNFSGKVRVRPIRLIIPYFRNLSSRNVIRIGGGFLREKLRR
jgi:hypothetical protein